MDRYYGYCQEKFRLFPGFFSASKGRLYFKIPKIVCIIFLIIVPWMAVLLFPLSNSYLQVASKLYISWGGEGEEGTGELWPKTIQADGCPYLPLPTSF